VTRPTVAVPDVAELCRSLVAIPSVGDRDGETAVVAHLAPLFAGLAGCDVRVIEPAPGRPSLLVDVRGPQPGPTLLLNGHSDTVSATPGWTRPVHGAQPEGDRLYGLGASDMKGGVAAIVCATLAVIAAGGPAAGNLRLAVTADEDAGMQWGVPWLAAEGLLDADAAIVAESAGIERDFERLAIASRGYGYVEVEVIVPKLAHASRYDPQRPHAVAVAADLVGAIEGELALEPAEHPLFPMGPTVVAGYEFTGGEALGRLAEHARFSVGARVLPGGRGEQVLERLAAFVQSRARGAQVTVTPVALSPFATGMELAPEHPLATLATAAVQSAGYPSPPPGGMTGFSEGAFLAARGIPTLPALGPGRGALAHGPDEFVTVSSLRAAVAIYDELIAAILRPGSPIAQR
jgi:succinyl-diaminopimelate desuccinylase